MLTYTSVVFNYLGPFFLKRILDSLDSNAKKGSTEKEYEIAYVYAVLAFLSQLCKVRDESHLLEAERLIVTQAQADLQHVWFSKRAATRIRSTLMAAIYDKTLKRKDFSGIVDKDVTKKKDPKAISASYFTASPDAKLTNLSRQVRT